ncbi:AMP-binding protein [Streptomyces sp. HNM0574]|uniref:class I adenylate-forming enzyme family protein n=1 Tax=Streptomyces sp. HNM0574 TaxID=2714954 RepID=UPI00146F0DC2|nr:AMP-binding protein [Streptomyces sp. HNM0574]NLU70915.1 AMP-binding protein [Streptomyces sp. HNM0574]
MRDTAHSELPHHDGTLWELLCRRVRRTPGATALVQAGGTPAADRRTGFAALHDLALRIAAGLHERGVRPGDTVVWQLPTRTGTVALSLALARLGAVQSPLIPTCRDRDVGLALRRTDAACFVHPGVWRGFDHAEMARRLLPGLRRTPLLLDDASLPDGDPARLPPPPTDPDAVRWIYWTSGTTAEPRGVLHTDRSLLAGGGALLRALRLTADDVGSIAFPYAHIGGADYLVMLLLRGFPAVLFEKFALPGDLAALRRLGVTTAGGSTAFYRMFLAEQRKRPGGRLLPSLRLLAGGGAPLPDELHEAVVGELGCALAHGYAMTEAPMVTMSDPRGPGPGTPRTEGRPPPGMEIRVTDGRGVRLPPGADGEVRLRGAAVCRGYLRAEDDAEAFDAEGWLRTGDRGRLTTDGELVLTGRIKDVIIRKGENISAQEIELLLHTHPAVGDVAVIGLPDGERGERVCAVVEPPHTARGTERATGALTLTGAVAYLRERGVAAHKLPEQLEIVAELPRNDTLRKVLKHELRERFSPRSP